MKIGWTLRRRYYHNLERRLPYGTINSWLDSIILFTYSVFMHNVYLLVTDYWLLSCTHHSKCGSVYLLMLITPLPSPFQRWLSIFIIHWLLLCFHHFRCGCEDCVTSRFNDSLRHSRSRINAYRALASPSLIALSSKDPILTAFELSWELRRLSFMEHEFRSEYQVRGTDVYELMSCFFYYRICFLFRGR